MPCWLEARSKEGDELSVFPPVLEEIGLSREGLGEYSLTVITLSSTSSGNGISLPSSVTRTSRRGSGMGAKRMRRAFEVYEPAFALVPSLVAGRRVIGEGFLG